MQPSSQVRSARLIFDSLLPLSTGVGRLFTDVLEPDSTIVEKKDARFREIVQSILKQEVPSAVQISLRTLEESWNSLIVQIKRGIQSSDTITATTVENIQKIQKTILAIESSLEQEVEDAPRLSAKQPFLIKGVPEKTRLFCHVYDTFTTAFIEFVSQVLDNKWGPLARTHFYTSVDEEQAVLLFGLHLLQSKSTLSSLRTLYGSPLFPHISQEEESALIQMCHGYTKPQLALFVLSGGQGELCIDRLKQLLAKSQAFMLLKQYVKDFVRVQTLPNDNDNVLAALNALAENKICISRLLVNDIAYTPARELCSTIITLFQKGRKRTEEELVNDAEVTQLLDQILHEKEGKRALKYLLRSVNGQQSVEFFSWLASRLEKEVIDIDKLSQLSEEQLVTRLESYIKKLVTTDYAALDSFIEHVSQHAFLRNALIASVRKSYESLHHIARLLKGCLQDLQRDTIVEDIIRYKAIVYIAEYDVEHAVQSVANIKSSFLKNEAHIAIAHYIAFSNLQRAQEVLNAIADESYRIVGYYVLIARCLELREVEKVFDLFIAAGEVIKQTDSERAFTAYAYTALSIYKVLVQANEQSLARFQRLLNAMPNNRHPHLLSVVNIISAMLTKEYEFALSSLTDFDDDALHEAFAYTILDRYLTTIFSAESKHWVAAFQQMLQRLSFQSRDRILSKLAFTWMPNDVFASIAISTLVSNHCSHDIRSTIVSHIVHCSPDSKREAVELKLYYFQQEFKQVLSL